MSAFNHNIKLIRALTKKKQPAFAELIKSNKSNIKTWETTETLPTDVLIYSRLAEIAGVTEHDIKTKKLTEKDINIKVEKVEQESTVSQSKYLQLLESNDRFFKNEYAQMLLSLKELIGLSKKQEALLKLNLQHVGAVEALQKGVEPEVIQEQINIQIADMGPSEETDNDAYNHGKP
jgi:hypothetical protein